MNSEANLMKKIMKALSALGCKVFRNNVGEAWVGNSRYISKKGFYECGAGDVIVRHARRFHGGLVEGSGDIIGWTPKKITPDMVGKTVAVFVSAEVKKDEKTALSASKSKQKHNVRQQNFAKAVKRDGGLSGFVGSVDQAIALVSSHDDSCCHSP